MPGGMSEYDIMHNAAFAPKDTIRWREVNGNILHPYWITQSYVGSYSISVDPTRTVPLVNSVKKNEANEFCLNFYYAYSELRKTPRPRMETLLYKISIKDTAMELQKAFQNAISRPEGLPDMNILYKPIFSTWAIFKRNITQEKLLGYFDDIVSNGYLPSNYEIDDGYEEHYGDHSFDKTKFPNVTDLINKIHEYGSRVTIWITPFINIFSSNFDKFSVSDCFVKGIDRNGEIFETVPWWNGLGGMVDFTSQECSDSFHSDLRSFMEVNNLDGIKFDAGETTYMPSDFITNGNISRSVDWTSAYIDSIRQNFPGNTEIRSSWAGQKHPLWLRMMDKDSVWGAENGLESLIPHLITASLLGYHYILPDMVGGNANEECFGCTYIPEEELYIRWIELTAFMPAIQFSLAPWQYESEETRRICKYWTDFHHDIIAPIYEEVWGRLVDGEDVLPIAPTSFLASEGELQIPAVYRNNQQFIIGEKYLVAPITSRNQREREVYLPGRANLWQNYWTKEFFRGGIYVNAQVELDEVSFWVLID